MIGLAAGELADRNPVGTLTTAVYRATFLMRSRWRDVGSEPARESATIPAHPEAERPGIGNSRDLDELRVVLDRFAVAYDASMPPIREIKALGNCTSAYSSIERLLWNG